MPSDISTPPGEALTDRGAARRERLLAAAEELFAELGYAATSPSDIAGVAGIGRTTFYEYFTDMEDLLAALVEERLPAVAEEMLAAVRREPTPSRQLTKLVVQMVEFAVTDPVLGLSLHQGLPALGSHTQARIAASHYRLGAEFGRVYRAGVEAGELRAMPLELIGRLLQDLVMAGAKTLIDLERPEERLAEMTDDLVHFLFHGLSNRPQ